MHLFFAGRSVCLSVCIFICQLIQELAAWLPGCVITMRLLISVCECQGISYQCRALPSACLSIPEEIRLPVSVSVFWTAGVCDMNHLIMRTWHFSFFANIIHWSIWHSTIWGGHVITYLGQWRALLLCYPWTTTMNNTDIFWAVRVILP